MGRLAYVFSGQGAQRAGMGKSFFDTNKTSKELFMQAEALRPGTLGQCFDGSAEELKLTENTQPCMYLADLAAAVSLAEAGLKPDAAAGFSLGEIPALAFAGAFSYADGFRIACVRGAAMGEASRVSPAVMMAVLRLEDSTVEEICAKVPGAWPANYNAPGQLVVSCAAECVPALEEKIKSAGGKLMPLSVSGGFHSVFMSSAADRFREEIKRFPMRIPTLPVYADCTARPYEGHPAELMEQQIIRPVLWKQLIENMASDGFDTFVEVGVGNTLKGLISRVLPGSRVFSVSSAEDVAEVTAAAAAAREAERIA
ncbi:MAG: ACP S-malonyltransferase [Clostridiales bacterium]|nr:ACP S-malonyltransferase [Clostridiales bacterium]